MTFKNNFKSFPSIISIMMICLLVNFFLTACKTEKLETNDSQKNKTSGNTLSPENKSSKASVESITIKNKLLIIKGQALDTITKVSIEGISHAFQINSQTENEIQASARSSLKLIAKKTYNLILSSASAETLAPIALISLAFDTLGANEGQVLRFNSSSQSWIPSDLNFDGLRFKGSWSPFTNTNPHIVSGGYGSEDSSPQEGDYYIISETGTTYPIDSYSDWTVGDWIVYGANHKWHKLTGKKSVTSFKGRTESVMPQSGDYNLSQLGDVDVTGAANGSILKWNGTKWIVGVDNTSGSSGSIVGSSLSLNNEGNSGGLSTSSSSINLEGNSNLILRSGSNVSSSNSDIIFQRGASNSPDERMRLTSIGLGIGTTTPGAPLDVKGAIRMSGSVSGYTGFQPAAAAGATVWTLPSIDGSNGQVLTTNGSGTLTWSTPATGDYPMASTSGVTAGLISKSDYDAFNAKLGTASTFSGDVSGSYEAINVDKIKGTTLSIASLTNRNFLKYDGTNWVNANITQSDVSGLATALSNKIDQSQLPASCAQGQTLTFLSPIGAWTCSNIFGSKNANLVLASPDSSAGTPIFRSLTHADLPSSVQNGLWSGNGTNIYHSSGNVGVGTINPENTLKVVGSLCVKGSGSNCVANDPGRIYAGDGTSVLPGFAFADQVSLGMYRPEHATLGFVTVGFERLRIDSSGNIGIGKTNPTAKLDVAGDVNVNNNQIKGFRAENSAAPPVTCDNTKKGYIYFNSTDNIFYGCNGSNFIKLSSSDTVASSAVSALSVTKNTNAPLNTILNWSGTSSSGFSIQRSIDNSNFPEISTTTNTTFQDSTQLSPATTYYYKICISGNNSICTTSISYTTGPEVLIYNTYNTAGVTCGNPPSASTFTISAPLHVTYISTYHWCSGGDNSTHTLNKSGGGSYGPYSTNYLNMNNRKSTPNTVIPAGTYTVSDSIPGSWSHTGGTGFTQVYGVY